MAPPRKTATTAEVLRVGDATVEYTVIRSSGRTRTIALHVEGGAVRVLAPVGATRAEIEGLVARRMEWIATRLAARAAAAPVFAAGARLPYRGVELALSVERAHMRAGRVEAIVGGLVVTLPVATAGDAVEARVRAALSAWYGREAGRLIGEAVAQWSATMGLTPKAVLVRDQKRRWGSCGPDGTLRFNWRLVMFAPAVLEYVAVHELSHLRHKNHGPAFWAEVAGWLPEYKAQRAALRGAGVLPL